MANTNLTGLFTNIANSIRAKDGTSNPIAAIDFADRINAIPTGGSTEFQYRTPDEIYEQDRPADWPVLPDPQEGECYFLFSRDGSSELRVVYDESMQSNYNQTSSWGYINENGEFVPAYSMERTGSSSVPSTSKWEWLGLSSVAGTEAENKMYPYYVLKTVGGGFYQGECRSSPSSESLLGQYLLEAKINIPDARYILNGYGSINPSSSQAEYLNLHRNLKFITLYNGTGKNLYLRYLCYNKGALRCIRFDSEANNFFTNGNFNGGDSAAYMFSGAVSLQCPYPIDKLTTVKNISYLYSRNRYLPYLEIHSSTATTATMVIGAAANCCEKASIILPSVTSSNFSIGYCPSELINFQVPALSPSNAYTIISSMPSPYYYTGIIKNVNLPNSKCYNWTTRQNNGVSAITFTEDCPPPDGVTFDCCSFSHQTLQDMIDTLPIAEGATLTIKFSSLSVGNTPYYSSVGINQKERDAFIQQITDKGYTVSVTLQ